MSTAEIEIAAPAPVIPQIIALRGPYGDYSAEFKAEIIAKVDAADGDVSAVAKAHGINESTIRGWMLKADRYRELREIKRLSLAETAENNAYLLADSIATHDLASAPLGQKATAFGIMVDKMQLLRGMPTNIGLNVDSAALAEVVSMILDSLNTPK